MPSTSTSGGNRHAPTRYANYLQVHETRMQRFLRGEFVFSDGVKFAVPAGGYIAVAGEIQCLGGIRIAVDKKLKILSGQGANALVQTSAYHYNAFVHGQGNLFRYDSPHGHRPCHHVHRFDFLKSWSQTGVQELQSVNAVPTLSDVIDEARELYYEYEF